MIRALRAASSDVPGYVPYDWETVTSPFGGHTRYAFANGVVLRSDMDGSGYVVFPPSGEVGSIGFPVKNTGDVFHALRKGATCAADLPAHCRAW